MPESSGGPLRGIVWMLVAVSAFAFMDASMKWLAPFYPPMEVTALRGLASLPLVLGWALLQGGVHPLLQIRWPLHLLRGVLSVAMLAGFVFALKFLPIAEAYSLFFIAPLLITALAVPMLGEPSSWQRWVAVALGFAGMLVILRPGHAGVMSTAGVVMMLAAVCYALSAVLVRVIGRTDSTQSMVVWMLAMVSVFALALAIPHWIPLRSDHYATLLVLGLSGAIGQYGITEAFRRAPASLIAPFEYTALLWGIALDWFVWKTAPDRWMLAGAAIIVAAGLYVLRHERAHVEAEHP